MADYDIILTPVADRPATPHGTDAGWIPYTLPYSLTGWPCVVVRAGTDPAGLPIGVQIVAGPWRDDLALAQFGTAAEHIDHEDVIMSVAINIGDIHTHCKIACFANR